MLACSVHLSADDLGRLPWDSVEIAKIVGGQNVQSMQVKRSDPQEDENFTFPDRWEVYVMHIAGVPSDFIIAN